MAPRKIWLTNELYDDLLWRFENDTVKSVTGESGVRLTNYIAALEGFKTKVADPETLFLRVYHESEGWYDGDDPDVYVKIRIYEYRQETDEEQAERIERDKERAKKSAAAARKARETRKKNIEAEERALLEKLKQKYPDA